MILNRKMREQMQKISRMLGAGSAHKTGNHRFVELPGNLPGASVPVPAFVKDLLTQLGVSGAGQPAPVDPIPRAGKPFPPTADRASTNTDYQGQFLTRSYTNHAGTRDYKLYVPSSYDGQPLPMVVMLHGCTQNPDDFANGTRMNQLAEEKQCFVVYPAQSRSGNASNCWNWFKSVDQQREQGEPSIIAGITREVTGNYTVDTNKVYVAGLSAGGAMAVIMATTYPELYAAVGVHSGLPYGSAQDLPSALAAMRGSSNFKSPPALQSIPMVVFHGDSDTTVHLRNGTQLMEQNTWETGPDVIVEEGQVPGGHRYTCTSHHGAAGRLLAEHWVVHGAGHAWSGGSSSGSYTDAQGPDASREMLRFFYAQSKVRLGLP